MAKLDRAGPPTEAAGGRGGGGERGWVLVKDAGQAASEWS